jgi:hypothetical protein
MTNQKNRQPEDKLMKMHAANDNLKLGTSRQLYVSSWQKVFVLYFYGEHVGWVDNVLGRQQAESTLINKL